MAANLSAQNSTRPLSSLGGAVQLASGAAPANGIVCHKLAVCFSVTGNLTIVALDGNTVTINSLPVGCYQFDVQFQSVTWTGTATAVGFYSIGG